VQDSAMIREERSERLGIPCELFTQQLDARAMGTRATPQSELNCARCDPRIGPREYE